MSQANNTGGYRVSGCVDPHGATVVTTGPASSASGVFTITTVADGSCTITATGDGGVTTTIGVTVVTPPTAINAQ